MTDIVCVLRSGGEYEPKHVLRLCAQVAANSPPGTEFVCHTDHVEEVGGLNVRAIALEHDWPKWWPKIETARRPGPVLYLDLDVSIVGDLTPLLDAAAKHWFAVAADFWHPDTHGINSSVMAWSGDLSWISDAFEADAAAIMAEYTTKQKWGDQAWLRDMFRSREMEPAYWQDLPETKGMVLSYKRDVLRGADTSNERIRVYHGSPKPWDFE